MQNSTAGQPTDSNRVWPTVAIVGVGYIGLPLAMSYARLGCRVIGVDVNESYVAHLQQGMTDSVEQYEGLPLSHYLKEAIASNSFTATTDFAQAAKESNIYIVTVGIPIYQGIPSYDAIDAATTSLAKVVKSGDLILYRSTHIPGTVRERLIPLLQSLSPYEMGRDVHVAYAPERVAEGRAMEEFQTVDVLVGGVNESSLAHAMEVLRVINRATLHPTSIDMAEIVKVVENVQRDVNIAMIQEIAKYVQAVGLQTSELVQLANTHPRVQLMVPGAGVGGYCIPNAYYYLQYNADKMGVDLPILSAARKTNDIVPMTILNRIERKLNWSATSWQGVRVAVLGLAMKNYSNDDRISPSIALVHEIEKRHAVVKAYDSLVAAEKYPTFAKKSLSECVKDAEIILVTIRQEEWDQLEFAELLQEAKQCRLVFDACVAIRAHGNEDIPLLRM